MPRDWFINRVVLSVEQEENLRPLITSPYHSDIKLLKPGSIVHIIAIREVVIDDIYYYLLLSKNDHIYKLPLLEYPDIYDMYEKLIQVDYVNEIYVLNNEFDPFLRIILWFGVRVHANVFVTCSFINGNESTNHISEVFKIKNKLILENEQMKEECERMIEYENRHTLAELDNYIFTEESFHLNVENCFKMDILYNATRIKSYEDLPKNSKLKVIGIREKYLRNDLYFVFLIEDLRMYKVPWTDITLDRDYSALFLFRYDDKQTYYKDSNLSAFGYISTDREDNIRFTLIRV
jgi:hypothetical protein